MKKILIIILFIILIPLPKTISIDSLYNDLKEYAKSVDIEHQNSYYDNVWKIVPGINGLKVDIDSSLKAMSTFDPNKVIFYDDLITNDIFDLKPGPIYKGNPKKKLVTIIINVAWGEDILPQMIKKLEELNVNVNFFIEGKFALKNKNLIKSIPKNHIIGNHSLKHLNFSNMTYLEQLNDIKEANNILKEIVGYDIKYFGPPSGAFNNDTNLVVRDLNMYHILFSNDTIDWQNPSVSLTVERVTKKLENGSIILMHPKENTLKALPLIINEIKKRNLKIGTLDDLLSPDLVL